jgi:predicted lipid-binding transport protein (Tim44 family)
MSDHENLEEQPPDVSAEQAQGENRQPEEPPWPTNGGPLGCLLGAITGVLLGGFLGTTLLIFDRAIGITLTVLLTIGLAVVGWQIGRSIFREYKPPKERRQKKKSLME